MLARVGIRALSHGRRFKEVLGQVGEMSTACGRLVAGRGRCPFRELILQMETCGARALGIVSLVGEPNQHQETHETSRGTPLVLVLAPVLLPGYLEREQVVTRTSEHSIVYSKRDRWAEPLDEAFEGILRQCLASRLAAQGISVQARRIGLVPHYALQVELLRFEKRGASHVELWARWTLRSKARWVRGDEVRIHEPTAGAEGRAAAAALSRAIDRLSDDVVSTMRRLD